jgi:periplasmic divalent cation tolerance protein
MMAKKPRRQYVQLQLTCANHAEAANIADALLQARLITCAKRLPVESATWWRGEIDQGSEVLLVMESADDLFPDIEAEITSLHSYEVFVLQSLPILELSLAAQDWADDALVPKRKRKKT